jgi:hypothetical protein
MLKGNYIIENGAENFYSKSGIIEKFGADNVIRIPQSEWGEIDFSNKYLDHFYLGETSILLGEKYLLCKVIDSSKPLLTLDGSRYVKVVELKKNISYQDVSDVCFKYSLKHIENIYDLKEILFKRYKTSRPYMGDEEIKNSKISYSRLEFI